MLQSLGILFLLFEGEVWPQLRGSQEDQLQGKHLNPCVLSLWPCNQIHSHESNEETNQPQKW